MKNNKRTWGIVVAIILGVAVLWGGSIYRDYKRSAWDAEVVAGLMLSYPEVNKEKILAEKYWKMYPDVSDHFYFGRNGRLKVYGAREHYRRHGKLQRRFWPE